jgi:hypothetical protein
MGSPLDHHVVYWLYDAGCVSPKKDGYIGASNNPTKQAWRYEKAKKFGDKKFQMKILFWGSKEECLAVERQLRPHHGIGWNKGAGGFKDGSGCKGVAKSAEHKAKIRAAALARYQDPAEHKRTSRDVKRGLGRNHSVGVNNPMFGREMSDKSKQKIRDRIEQRGGVFGKNNPNYRHGRYSDS